MSSETKIQYPIVSQIIMEYVERGKPPVLIGATDPHCVLGFHNWQTQGADHFRLITDADQRTLALDNSDFIHVVVEY